jgi:hypothetical protein
MGCPTWGRPWPQRRWVAENDDGLGRHLAQWLVARGETVVDVPASATNRVRQLTRGGGRKNDRIDAAAAATAHIHGDGRQVDVDDHTFGAFRMSECPSTGFLKRLDKTQRHPDVDQAAYGGAGHLGRTLPHLRAAGPVAAGGCYVPVRTP